MKDRVSFHFQKNISLRDRNRLKLFLVKMAGMKKKETDSLSIVFCSDKYLLNINKLYLNHDYFTDIITFDYSEHRGMIHGELFISIDRVRENASHLGVSTSRELHRVIFHGLLHLLGYKDKKAADIKKIRREEDRWLSLYFR